MPDVAYWTNVALWMRGPEDLATCPVCINCAVEESTLRGRSAALLPQDDFAARNMAATDVVVVSVGGNDVVLAPTTKTIGSMLWLARFASLDNILAGTAWGMGHMVALFHDALQDYVRRVCCASDKRPVAVVVCAPYFPGTKGSGWADGALNALGYSFPLRLQAIIRVLFNKAIAAVTVPGVRVIPLPLYEVLDADEERDYVARVEPSVLGGRKMGAQIASLVLRALKLQ